MNLWIYGAGQDREGKKTTRTPTTRYVTLLSVVLALALTAALAACGSDEPSGVTGPDRTASTPGSGDAPTATDATAAATAPPVLGPGSLKTDREAVVAFYNATGGENWVTSYNWLSDAPLDEWEGVRTNDDGRVTSLYLDHNDLSGEIPAELGSLSNLRNLWLNHNDLSGEIPAELGSLSNLTMLWLYDNDLSGEIPAELGNLSNLTELRLGGNHLSGEIPPELGSLSNLEALELYPANYDLSGCVPSSLEDQMRSAASTDIGILSYC